MAEINDVVAKLAKLTEQRQVPWKTTVDSSTFAATFGRMSVLISRKNPLLLSDGESYTLSVLDEKGDEIDFVTATHVPFTIDENHTPTLVDLYNSAKRIALVVNERLEELLNEMDRVSGS